nr:MAG TPA: hypothetical protein [Caudoviricetes sp.]
MVQFGSSVKQTQLPARQAKIFSIVSLLSEILGHGSALYNQNRSGAVKSQ